MYDVRLPDSILVYIVNKVHDKPYILYISKIRAYIVHLTSYIKLLHVTKSGLFPFQTLHHSCIGRLFLVICIEQGWEIDPSGRLYDPAITITKVPHSYPISLR
jgi:hypothetical protein